MVNLAIRFVICAVVTPLATAIAAIPPTVYFTAAEMFAGPKCCSIVTGDFNGDGKPDLAVTYAADLSSTASVIALYLGNGDGTFKSKTIATLNGPARLVAAVDVSGGRKLGLLVQSNADWLLFRGNGDGTFQSPIAVPGPVLAVADFNGDGKPDLLLAGFTVRFGNGDGTFGPAIESPSIQSDIIVRGLGSSASIAVADVDGDGKLDFVFTSNLHEVIGTLFVCLGNGDGTFRLLEGGIPYSGVFRAFLLATGDFDADGRVDLAVGALQATSNGTAFVIGVLFGNGDGTFTKGPLSQIAGSYFIVGDFNGDGKLDIAADSSVALGNGDGTFQPQMFFGHGPSWPTGAPVAADFNHDGKLDLVIPSRITATYGDSLLSFGMTVSLNAGSGPPTSVVGVSAANGQPVLAPGSIASIYGSNLAAKTESSPSTVLPDGLGGISVHVRDAFGTDRLAPLFSVSPTQINFLVPELAATGFATVTTTTGIGPYVEGFRATPIDLLAPALFSADGTGSGAAAATAVRILPNGEQAAVTVFRCTTPTDCSTVPIDLGNGPVYLSLYGTGFANATSATCQIHGQASRATYVGRQGGAGLDQVNLLLPAMSGVGETDVVCYFAAFEGGSATGAKPVRINIQ